MFIFTDGTADKLVMEKEVVYVSFLSVGVGGGGATEGQPDYSTFLCNWPCELWKKQFSHERFHLLQNYIITVKEMHNSKLSF